MDDLKTVLAYWMTLSTWSKTVENMVERMVMKWMT